MQTATSNTIRRRGAPPALHAALVIGALLLAAPGAPWPYRAAAQEAVALYAAVGEVLPDPRTTAVDAVDVRFSATVAGFDIEDVTLQRDGLPLGLAGAGVKGDGDAYSVAGLADLTGKDGVYLLSVSLAGVVGAEGQLGAGWASDTWVVDTVAPAITILGPATPRTTGVTSVTVELSEPLGAGALTAADVVLTRNGGTPLPLEDDAVTQVDADTFVVGGLAALTAPDGVYLLTVRASSVRDPAGNQAAADAVAGWTVDASGPVVSLGSVAPDPRSAPVPAVGVTFSEALLAGSFGAEDVQLTRDGVPLDLPAGSIGGDGAMYVIGGLSALTAAEGAYALTIDSGGVRDSLGNIGSGGASEHWVVDTSPPAAALDAPDVTVPGGAYLFTVTYSDNLAVSLTTIDVGDVTVRGPEGFALQAVPEGPPGGTEAQPVVTYRITAPGGLWDAEDAGLYTVELAPGEVLDAAGNSVPGGALGSFTAAVPGLRRQAFLPAVFLEGR